MADKPPVEDLVSRKSRLIMQEFKRDQIDFEEVLGEVREIITELFFEHETLSKTSIAALGKAADLNMRLLNKHLPDIKQIEHSGAVEMPVEVTNKIEYVANLTTEELDRLIAEKLTGGEEETSNGADGPISVH